MHIVYLLIIFYRVTTVNLKDGTTTVTSVSINAAKTLNVEILPSTAVNKTITATSSNTAVATVSVNNFAKSIIITPVAIGTSAVTVTVDGVVRTLTVNVTAIWATAMHTELPTSPGWEQNTLIFNRGSSRTLNVVHTPLNTTNKTITASSSNTSVATVSVSGQQIIVNGVAAGSVVITVRNTTSGVTYTVNVTILN